MNLLCSAILCAAVISFSSWANADDSNLSEISKKLYSKRTASEQAILDKTIQPSIKAKCIQRAVKMISQSEKIKIENAKVSLIAEGSSSSEPSFYRVVISINVFGNNGDEHYLCTAKEGMVFNIQSIPPE